MSRPCTVVGTGCVSAAGVGKAAAWRAYGSGGVHWRTDPGTGLPVYPVPELPTGGPVADFARRYRPDRAGLLALHAADAAVRETGWEEDTFAVLVGCSRGPTESWESSFRQFERTGTPPLRTSPRTTLGSLGFTLAEYFGRRASLASSLSVTCSSGLHALLHGVALLQTGWAERVLVGGAEAPLTDFTLRQMAALGVYASAPTDGRAACRPLSDPATGMVVGEGAAFLALERRDDPSTLTGKVSVLGVGFGQEHGRGATGISATGEALQAAMQMATAADPRPDGIVAHAPGTPRGDAAERRAVAAVFGADQPPLTSLKWATGHTFGASGALALVAAGQMIEHGRWIGLNDDADTAARTQVRRLLVNATGFGGNAVSVLLGTPD